MTEYIEREAAIAWFMPYAHAGESIEADVVISDLKGMKAADVEPVKRGRWIPAVHVGDCCYRCSECQFLRDAYLIDIGNYCPNCGAKMN